MTRPGGKDPGGGRYRQYARNAAVVVNAAGTFVAAVLGGFFLGYFLDKRLGLMPAFTLAGSLVGMAAAVYVIFKETRRLLK